MIRRRVFTAFMHVAVKVAPNIVPGGVDAMRQIYESFLGWQIRKLGDALNVCG